MDYPSLIKKIRNKMLVTQEELASILGCSFSSVNRWEKGHYEPTMKIKRKIIELCKKHSINIE